MLAYNEYMTAYSIPTTTASTNNWYTTNNPNNYQILNNWSKTITTTLTNYYDTNTTHTLIYEPYSLTTTGNGYWTTTQTNTTTDWTWKHRTPTLTPQQKLQQALQARLTPYHHHTRKPTPHTHDPKETRARETLQLCLGEQQYRKYLKHGFITAQAKSGLTYQIYPGHGITNVYKNGQMIERLCVVLNGPYPPADSLIMRYLLILNDEQTFRNKAIPHKPHQTTHVAPQHTQLTLPELYKQLKQNAA